MASLLNTLKYVPEKQILYSVKQKYIYTNKLLYIMSNREIHRNKEIL